MALSKLAQQFLEKRRKIKADLSNYVRRYTCPRKYISAHDADKNIMRMINGWR